MDFFQAFILGIVQGMTEFLPVSSSGHLVIFQKFLGLEEHSLVFDVAVHLGTLASVITIYFKFLRQTTIDAIRGLKSKTFNMDLRLISYVITATIPTAIIGLVFKSRFEALFSNLFAVGICLCITGCLLIMTRNRGMKESSSSEGGFFKFSLDELGHLNWQKALILGVAQAGAIAPGISRSGTTIAVAILLGLPRNVSAMFSFMLAIPAILGAGVLQLKDVTSLHSQDLIVLLFGFIVAYIAGLLGLWLVLHFVKKGRLEVFTAYLWILGGYSVYWSLQ